MSRGSRITLLAGMLLLALGAGKRPAGLLDVTDVRVFDHPTHTRVVVELSGSARYHTGILEDPARKPHAVFAVGPVPMMSAVAEQTRSHNVKTIVSLNPIMVDGTGMCGGCRVTIGGETKFACVDGPEFDGHQVDFSELVNRQNTYNEDQCRLDAQVANLKSETAE